MPLPLTAVAKDAPWPPPRVAGLVAQQREWAAWWGGNIDHLRNNSNPRRYWYRQAATDSRVRTAKGDAQDRAMHAALAADMVSTSADLLFGDPIDLTIPPPVETGETGEQTDGADVAIDASVTQEAAAVAVTQARLDELRDLIDLDGTLLVAGETSSALGGVWLRPAWDPAVADHPLLTTVEAEFAVPVYRLGQLTSVTFWEVVSDADSDVVWRHLERHETEVGDDGVVRGVILHGLYRGDADKLGQSEALTEHEATATLTDRIELPDGVPPILPRYMPNVLPNRKYRQMPVGRSDFDGIEDELDALDEAWTSLLRDIRLGVARLVVPEGTLKRRGEGPGSGRGFDVDEELMIESDVDPDKTGARPALLQGAIRDASHLATIRALTEAAVSGAGYAPATFGLGIDGAAESGTARSIRERKTFRTLRRKRRYAARAVADTALALLAIDAVIFEREGIVPMLPRVGWSDVTAEPRTTAERLQLLRAAQAISIRNAVKEAQPDLTDDEVDVEVRAIMAELGQGVGDPEDIGRDEPPADNLEPVEGADDGDA